MLKALVCWSFFTAIVAISTNTVIGADALIPEVMNLKDGDSIPSQVLKKYTANQIAASLVARIRKKESIAQEGKVARQSYDFYKNSEIHLYFQKFLARDFVKSGALNQHQVGRSVGRLAPVARSQLESKILGVDIEPVYVPDANNPAHQIRPKYAVLQIRDPEGFFSDPEGRYDAHSAYGEVVAVLKDDVKERSLWVPGDSMDRRMEILSEIIVPKTFHAHELTERNTPVPYYEAVIVGTVTNEDVKYFMVPRPPDSGLLASLKSANVPIYTYKEESRGGRVARIPDALVFMPQVRKKRSSSVKSRSFSTLDDATAMLTGLDGPHVKPTDLIEAWKKYSKIEGADDLLLEIWKRMENYDSNPKNRAVLKQMLEQEENLFYLKELLRLSDPESLVARWGTTSLRSVPMFFRECMLQRFSFFARDPAYGSRLSAAIIAQMTNGTSADDMREVLRVAAVRKLPDFEKVLYSFLENGPMHENIISVLAEPGLLENPNWGRWFDRLIALSGGDMTYNTFALAAIHALASEKVKHHSRWARYWEKWVDRIVADGRVDGAFGELAERVLFFSNAPRFSLWVEALQLPPQQRAYLRSSSAFDAFCFKFGVARRLKKILNDR